MTPDELLRRVRDADRHRGGLRCLRLFTVDDAWFARVRADVLALVARHAGSDVRDPGHVTHWTGPVGDVRQFSLLNASGRFDDFSADHDLSVFGKRFHGRDAYPELARLVDAFPHALNFRIGVLGPLSALRPHEEHALVRTRAGTIGARLRLHLPVCTTPGATIVLDGDVHRLDEATIYFVNHGCVHEARNDDDERARVHLVWDVLLTHDAYALLFGERAAPAGLRRIDDEERDVAPVGRRVVGRYERVPPLVTPAEAGRVALCPLE